jgi:anti-sigma regulatory factor (Ser/Thr protein kinase)
VEVNVLVDRIEVVIRDEGPGFAWTAALAASREAAALGQLSKRGHVLMQAFMDEVTYNDRGNELRMVKRADA